MDHPTRYLEQWLEILKPCFHPSVHPMFCGMVYAWILCLGKRTISRIWQTTGRAKDYDHSSAYRVFNSAVWNWDEIAKIHILKLMTVLIPGTRIWCVVDDTLCHKRGAKVAFGGIFLDAVLSSRGHKIFRHANNWVTVGLIVQLPFQKRFLCLNVLWRICDKKNPNKPKEHRTKPMLAAEMLEKLCAWVSDKQVICVGDVAYMGKSLLKDRPDNLDVIGPIHPKAKLTKPACAEGGRRKIGELVTTPRQAQEDPTRTWQKVVVKHPKGRKRLLVHRLHQLCWYRSAGPRPLQVVLVHDPEGKWRDEALLCTDLSLSPKEVIEGYMRRWSVEVAYFESKQLLGFHEQRVWSEKAVERTAPMAWYVASVVVAWYVQVGQYLEQAERWRPWYTHKASVSFADMLACLRLHLWRDWLNVGDVDESLREKLEWLLQYMSTAE